MPLNIKRELLTYVKAELEWLNQCSYPDQFR